MKLLYLIYRKHSFIFILFLQTFRLSDDKFVYLFSDLQDSIGLIWHALLPVICI